MLIKITYFDIFLPIVAVNDTKVINIIVYEPFRSSAGVHAKNHDFRYNCLIGKRRITFDMSCNNVLLKKRC